MFKVVMALSLHCSLLEYYAESIRGWVLPRCWYVLTKLQGMIAQKAIILIVCKLMKCIQNDLGWGLRGKSY